MSTTPKSAPTVEEARVQARRELAQAIGRRFVTHELFGYSGDDSVELHGEFTVVATGGDDQYDGQFLDCTWDVRPIAGLERHDVTSFWMYGPTYEIQPNEGPRA